jgi:hypothetical protein
MPYFWDIASIERKSEGDIFLFFWVKMEVSPIQNENITFWSDEES